MIAPDDYEHEDFQPRVKLLQSVRKFAGGTGWDIMRWLFDNPQRGYIITVPHHEYYAEVIARLEVWGLVAPAFNGYQLTADGRYYVALELKHKQPRQEFFWSNYTPDELAMLDIAYGNEEQPFDLLDF